MGVRRQWGSGGPAAGPQSSPAAEAASGSSPPRPLAEAETPVVLWRRAGFAILGSFGPPFGAWHGRAHESRVLSDYHAPCVIM